MKYGKKKDPPEHLGFVYRDGEHDYHSDRVEMTGVTTVLGVAGSPGGLMQYAANYGAARAFCLKTPAGLKEALENLPKLDTPAARELDKAYPEWKDARTAHARNTGRRAEAGTDNHALAEAWEQGQEILIGTPELDHYKTWYAENVEKTLFVERPLFSKRMFVGGTPDGGFLMKDGKRLINDKKFKDSLFDNKAFWQMAAYRMMIEEMLQDEATPVRLEWKDGSVEEFASPKKYLESIVGVDWDGSVVLTINGKGVVPSYRFAYEEDRDSFESVLKIYKRI